MVSIVVSLLVNWFFYWGRFFGTGLWQCKKAYNSNNAFCQKAWQCVVKIKNICYGQKCNLHLYYKRETSTLVWIKQKHTPTATCVRYSHVSVSSCRLSVLVLVYDQKLFCAGLTIAFELFLLWRALFWQCWSNEARSCFLSLVTNKELYAQVTYIDEVGIYHYLRVPPGPYKSLKVLKFHTFKYKALKTP